MVLLGFTWAGSGLFRFVWLRLDLLGSVCRGLAWNDWAWLGVAWVGVYLLGLGWFGLACVS